MILIFILILLGAVIVWLAVSIYKTEDTAAYHIILPGTYDKVKTTVNQWLSDTGFRSTEGFNTSNLEWLKMQERKKIRVYTLSKINDTCTVLSENILQSDVDKVVVRFTDDVQDLSEKMGSDRIVYVQKEHNNVIYEAYENGTMVKRLFVKPGKDNFEFTDNSGQESDGGPAGNTATLEACRQSLGAGVDLNKSLAGTLKKAAQVKRVVYINSRKYI